VSSSTFEANPAWGSITGTLSAQTDLKDAFETRTKLSSFTATAPIYYNNTTGAFTSTLISATTGMVGTLQAAQFPALTGDITTSAGSLATSAAGAQGNIKTFSSSITVTNTAGLKMIGPITGSSFTFVNAGYASQITSNTVLGATTIYADGLIRGSNITGSASGSNTGDQTISLTGDVTGSGTGSFAATLAAPQANVRTFSSSITVTGPLGVNVTYGVIAGSMTAGPVTVTSNTIMSGATFYQGGPIVFGSTFTIGNVVLMAGSAGTAGQVLSSNGPGLAPTWQADDTGGGGGGLALQPSTATVTISSGLALNGSAGSSGQYLKSNGANTVPSWDTPAAVASPGGVGNNVQINNGAGAIGGATGFNVWSSSVVISTGMYETYTSTLNVASSMTVSGISNLNLSAVSLTLGAMAAPTAPSDGTIWNDSSNEILAAYINSATHTLTGVIYTVNTTSTNANNTGEADMLPPAASDQTLTFPANFFSQNKTIFMVLMGTITINSTNAIQPRILFGSTVIASTISLAGVATTMAEPWELRLMLNCRSIGASARIFSVGVLRIPNTRVAIETFPLLDQGNTIDTTASQTIRFTQKWGTANAANIFTLIGGFIEVMN
jgi:uncharacterized protein (DUF2147 family)